ncbi:CTP synthase, partial [Colibacter massiliensis]
NADIVITEIGGTVGDIESLPFLEAIRQIKKEVGRNDVLYIHVTLVPYIGAAGELKTKPTQHSVKELRGIGIQPDIIVCRSEKPLSEEMKDKLALFCDIDKEAVIQNRTLDSIYEVPLLLAEEGLDTIVLKKLDLPDRPCDMEDWKKMVYDIYHTERDVEIALVGKYVALHDAYLSVAEALSHAGTAYKVNVNIRWIDSETLEEPNVSPAEVFRGVAGIIVPGGFGNRGIEGKVKAIQYARENKIPFLGLCLGMQCSVMDFARHVCGMKDATSSEFDETAAYPVIDLMADQVKVSEKGGTMRLGLYPCKLVPGTKAHDVYGEDLIYERHRHRWEFNNKYRKELTHAGLVISGTSPDDRLVEIVEIADHPWFVGCQFHPEFKSRPTKAHPLFKGFIKAALERE